MAQNKTQENHTSVGAFLNSIENPERRRDAKSLLKLFKETTGQPAKMWGSSIVGFDRYHYRYDSGREGDFMMTGFSPRKQNSVVYIMLGFTPYQTLLDKLGKYKLGKSCLYIKRLEDVDTATLTKLIRKSYTDMRKKYPG